jgi:hypothetical protein
MTKIAGSGSESGSGSISQRHGSEDPDPPQNVMDPQHWFLGLPDPHPDPLVTSMDPDRNPFFSQVLSKLK